MEQAKTARGQVPRLGAWVEEGVGVRWRVWAPTHQRVEVVLHGQDGQPGDVVPLKDEGQGFFSGSLAGRGAGVRYKLRVDGEGPFPDPWSRSQPEGVHGPSEVVVADFAWTDKDWKGVDPKAQVIYEVHVGTVTPEGTFDALISRLDAIKDLGATTLELLPLSSWPGTRNWGYDGVALFAPPAVYGGPEGLRRLIDAAHARGLGVLIDAVYNHFGPDGNYLRCFSPHYFTGKHHTPWGEAINYDGEGSDVVRELVLSNVDMWIRDYHADGLRLDAAHAIIDDSRPHLLTQIAERARAAAGERTATVIAEDDRNDTKLVGPPARDGHALDGVWADDLHHQLRRAFAGDSEGYYADYTGSVADIARTLRQGWFYEGQQSQVHKKPRGTPASSVEPWHFVHCIQNHDQIGNRAQGERLGADVTPAAFRAMSTVLLLSPYTPLLFQGQEWNASSPFIFFTDHNAELGKLVTEGRRKEFAGFSKFSGATVPDPQASETFERSKLDWSEADKPEHAGVRALYKELLHLRATEPSLQPRGRGSYDARPLGDNGFLLERQGPEDSFQVIVAVKGPLEYPLPETARLVLWSEAARFGGADEKSPLTAGVLKLQGPSAVVVRLTK